MAARFFAVTGISSEPGTQTTSTIIRAIALGEIRLRDGLRVLLHELSTGLLLGVVMAVVAYIRALTWGTSDDLGLAVALSIMVIVIWANCVGAVLPLLANRLRIDPTVVSGPLMSTLVDATGLFLYFTIAGAILGL